MANLRCFLAGFDAHGASQIEGLAGLVHAHLSDDWSFGASGASPYDLLLCDVDTAPGAAAWQDGGQQGVPRAAVAHEAPAGGGLTLLKPLRLHGPGGVVHVLNEGARLGAALAGPGQTCPASASPMHALSENGVIRPRPDRQGGLRSFLRILPAWLSGPLARAPTQPPVPQAVPPHGTVSSDIAADPAPGKVEAWDPKPAPGAAADVGAPAEPSHAADTAVMVRPAAAHTLASAAVVLRDAAAIDTDGYDLLQLLRRARAASQVIVVRMDGVPAICAAPANGMAYTLATLRAIYDSPRAAFWTSRVTVAQNSYHGRIEVLPNPDGPPVSVPAVPLKNLLWVATLRCGGADEGAPYRDGTFKLRAWPDLGSLPHARHHMAWCGLLARRPMTAVALAGKTSHDPEEAAVFMAACHELGILHRKDAASAPVPRRHALANQARDDQARDDQAQCHPDAAGEAPTRQVSERASVLRSILGRLGLQRP